MKPETAAFLAKAEEILERAKALQAQNFTDEAGRAAYLAGFHAAQAILFERHGRTPKTHSGVQTKFAE
ncbi:MAG: HEPN domain-containing protein [Alphaproteobacteria bacterium]|nr:HEPN domain-containing protein [Alphaproteobacteria bacterium]MDE2110376.1 HEPN domain-containing protein [Alphaproteobacteria bacterium]MDE2496044.1 HEPN domain-containing protein [Alphaproteobacteria bacterium]